MNVKIFFLVIILLIIFKKYLIETMFNTKRENEVNELNTSTDGGGGGGGGGGSEIGEIKPRPISYPTLYRCTSAGQCLPDKKVNI